MLNKVFTCTKDQGIGLSSHTQAEIDVLGGLFINMWIGKSLKIIHKADKAWKKKIICLNKDHMNPVFMFLGDQVRWWLHCFGYFGNNAIEFSLHINFHVWHLCSKQKNEWELHFLKQFPLQIYNSHKLSPDTSSL